MRGVRRTFWVVARGLALVCFGQENQHSAARTLQGVTLCRRRRAADYAMIPIIRSVRRNDNLDKSGRAPYAMLTRWL